MPYINKNRPLSIMKFCASSERPKRNKTKLVLLQNNFVGYLFFSLLYNLLNLFKIIMKFGLLFDRWRIAYGFGGVQSASRALAASSLLLDGRGHLGVCQEWVDLSSLSKKFCCWLLMDLSTRRHHKEIFKNVQGCSKQVFISFLRPCVLFQYIACGKFQVASPGMVSDENLQKND